MLSVLIIEDELPNAARLEKMLRLLDKDVDIVGIIQNVQESVAWLRSNQHPDLICMDIKLTDGLSFEIFDRTEIHSQVIFITAYDEYALRAFQVNGIDYLLKPVQAAKLENSIRKVKAIIGAITDNSVLVQTLKKIHLRQQVYRSRFLISYRDMFLMVPVSEVAYFASENKVTFLTTHANKRYTIEQTLEELESELDPAEFFRVSRQFIISVKSIAQIHQSFNGKLTVQLTPPTTESILASREKSASLKRWLDYR
jgi:two-component system, LytTR family, response regulator LytT